jgi:lysophospholipase L1-like esterase
MGRLIIALFVALAAAHAQTDRVAALEHLADAQRKLIRDWGGLTRYGSADAELPPPAPGENRVVFFGDDATEFWGQGDSQFFPGKPYVNRGIAGQSSPQMLVRFRQDVVALRPKVVVIQGGMNDIAAWTVPGSKGMISEHFESMIDLANANRIAVVLASLLPVCDCGSKLAAFLPRGKILGLNDWLEQAADERGAVFLNYYSALVAGRDFKHEWTKDGVLPNAAGYAVMAPLAEHAIAQALAAKSSRR